MNSDESNSTPAPASVGTLPLLDLFKARLREQYEAQVIGAAQLHVAIISRLDSRAHILARIPDRFIDKCNFFGADQIDFDNLSRDDAVAIMVAMRAGEWTKTPNVTHPTQIDYQAKIEGLTIRLWAAGPPDSCRIVEYDEPVPATVIKRRRLVCKKEGTPEPATPPCAHSYVEGSTVCTICGS